MPPKVSDSYKEEKRSVLLASALHCFAEKGYQATTVDDIVRHAKASKGAIYHYFTSKEEIFLELLRGRENTAFEEIRSQLAQFNSASEKLQFMIYRYKKFPQNQASRNFQRVHLEFFLYSASHDHLKRIMEERYEMFAGFIAEILKDGIESGEFRKDLDIRHISSLFWAIRDGIGLHFVVLDAHNSYEKIWTLVEEMLLEQIRK
jgi:AcrR family transcriptional regulator